MTAKNVSFNYDMTVLKIWIMILGPFVYWTCFSCPINYKSCKSICINDSGPMIRKTFCEASAFCYKIGGRLALDDEIRMIENCIGDSNPFLTSLTDLYKELSQDKKGWMDIGGSLNNDKSLWNKDEPNSGNGGEDCTSYDVKGLNDVKCSDQSGFVCVSFNDSLMNKRIFVKDNINIYNEDEQGCYKNMTVRSKLECGTL